METLKLTCDGCGKDLHEGLSQDGYALMLSNIRLEHRASFHTAMWVHPPLDGPPVHFCNWSCLGVWLTRTNNDLVRRWAGVEKLA